jgi:hypothetical protein
VELQHRPSLDNATQHLNTGRTLWQSCGIEGTSAIERLVISRAIRGPRVE